MGAADTKILSCCVVCDKARGVTLPASDLRNNMTTHEVRKDIIADEVRNDDVVLTEAEDQRRLQAVSQNRRRSAIATESISEDKIKNYKKPVYLKDPKDQAFIKNVISNNSQLQVLLGHCKESTLNDVVNAFMLRSETQSTDLIRQGEEGDSLYILEEGEVDIFVARPGADGQLQAGRGGKVGTLGPRSLFGELALMYQAPRAATVTVASPTCKLWSLDREPFKMLLVQSESQTVQSYQEWLGDVEILKSLNKYELSRLSDAMESELFDLDETIVEQGEIGDKFYILEEGTCSAFVRLKDGSEKEVQQYTRKGQYFGELALLKGVPRAATVRATGSGAVVVSLSKEDFTNLLGPVENILEQHTKGYAKVK